MSEELERLYSIYKQASSVTSDPKQPNSGSLYVSLKNFRPKKPILAFAWHIWTWLELNAPGLRKYAIKMGHLMGEKASVEALDYVYDGNAYVKQALDNGAAYALTDNPKVSYPPQTVHVADATETLYDLARHHRKHIQHPIIGITGSVGKTTTTNLVHAILGSEKKAYMQGGRNTPAANSINLLNIPHDADAAVFEMGTLKPGLLAGACDIIRPTHAIITTINYAHMDTFRDLAEIQTSKWEMFEHIIHSDSTAFLNMNHEWLASKADLLPNKVTYGCNPAYDIHGHMLSADPYLKMRWYPNNQEEPIDIQTRLAGQHNVDNILAGIAVGSHFGLSNELIKYAIENFETVSHRSEIFYSGSNTIYCETYQSNPTSTKFNLKSFENFSSKRKVLIIGPIARTPSDHIIYDEIIDQIKSMDLDQIFFLTGEYDRFRDQNIGVHVDGREEIKVWLEENRPEDTCFMLNFYDGYYDVRSLFQENGKGSQAV
ncbi:MAG: Mur ligase family protein [Chloroflexota bacterium]